VVGEDDRLGLKKKRTSAVAADVSASGREEILGRLPGVLERYSALQVRGGRSRLECAHGSGALRNLISCMKEFNSNTGCFSSCHSQSVSPVIPYFR
jgi:hypothetical protein